jgi:hypothetical protein
MVRQGMTPAVFAARLNLAITAKGMTIIDVHHETGVSLSALYKIRRGLSVPSIQTAARLAEVLDMPSIGEAALALRTKQCIVCTGTFVDRGRNNTGRCCGQQCSQVMRVRRERKASEEYFGRLHVIARRRMSTYTRAVLAFCSACEPEGMCRKASCELRPVSPLPLKGSAKSSTVARIAAPRVRRTGNAGA